MDKKPGNRYVLRDYRTRHEAKDLHYFQVCIQETDLAIGVDKASYADCLLALGKEEILRLRSDLEYYISYHPEFRTSFIPLQLRPGAPAIASIMSKAALCAGVGPMAAVAGAIAQTVGEKLASQAQEVIVENGGDIYLNSRRDRLISVFAGQSFFSHKIALRVKAEHSPLGICTSSGTVGPSISLGRADAVVILSPHTALADAVATGAANLVQDTDDLMKAVNYAKAIKGVTGILAIQDDKMAAWGNIEVVGI